MYAHLLGKAGKRALGTGGARVAIDGFWLGVHYVGEKWASLEKGRRRKGGSSRGGVGKRELGQDMQSKYVSRASNRTYRMEMGSCIEKGRLLSIASTKNREKKKGGRCWGERIAW